VTLTSSDVGLSAVNNTSDASKPVSTLQAAADAAVQAYAIQRAYHTGTQLASTISDFATEAAKFGPVTSVNGQTGAVTISGSGTYTLPAATVSTLGGVIVGNGLSVSSGTLSAAVTSVAGRTGAITLTSADVANVVSSDPTGISGADAITNMVSLTAAEYAALGSKSASTLYVIVG
jgi:hypothetical protein